jgi:hypothetical protein
MKLPTAGLALTVREGFDRLPIGIDWAMAEACNPGDLPGARMAPNDTGRREMTANVRLTRQQIAARATEKRSASNIANQRKGSPSAGWSGERTGAGGLSASALLLGEGLLACNHPAIGHQSIIAVSALTLSCSRLPSST